MRLLIADDDRRLAAALAEGLRYEGYAVDIVHDGVAACVSAAATDYDLIILDIQMPKANGYVVVKHLRREQVWAPVLMLTAKDGEYDQAEGLDSGADDYLTKPFSYVVLLARIRLLLRRTASNRPISLQVGELYLNPVSRSVRRADSEITLTTKEFTLLHSLMRRVPYAISKVDLIAAAWDDHADLDPNVLEVHISALRRKVDGPFGTCSIETIRGYGYRFTAGAGQGR